MKVMVFVKASSDSDAGKMPSPEVFRAMGAFNQQLADAGVMLLGEGLTPTSRGKRVRCAGSERTIIDGPFAETKELVAGFWMWNVASMDEAIDWIKKSPFQEGEIELRPVFGPEDFAGSVPADVIEQGAKLRAKIEGKG
jgi:hypothetical protein